MAKRKADVGDIDIGWLVLADLLTSDGKANAGRHWALVVTNKKEIDERDQMEIVPISHQTALARPEDMVEVDPAYGLDRNCYAVCSWMIDDLLHRNAVVQTHRPPLGWEAFVLKVQTIRNRLRQPPNQRSKKPSE